MILGLFLCWFLFPFWIRSHTLFPVHIIVAIHSLLEHPRVLAIENNCRVLDRIYLVVHQYAWYTLGGIIMTITHTGWCITKLDRMKASVTRVDGDVYQSPPYRNCFPGTHNQLFHLPPATQLVGFLLLRRNEIGCRSAHHFRHLFAREPGGAILVMHIQYLDRFGWARSRSPAGSFFTVMTGLPPGWLYKAFPSRYAGR